MFTYLSETKRDVRLWRSALTVDSSTHSASIDCATDMEVWTRRWSCAQNTNKWSERSCDQRHILILNDI
jgi:hypothetical protein